MAAYRDFFDLATAKLRLICVHILSIFTKNNYVKFVLFVIFSTFLAFFKRGSYT